MSTIANVTAYLCTVCGPSVVHTAEMCHEPDSADPGWHPGG
jgi:hypothetical protein